MSPPNQHVAPFQDAAYASDPFWPVPTDAPEFLAVHLFEARNNQILQFNRILSYGCGIEAAHE